MSFFGVLASFSIFRVCVVFATVLANSLQYRKGDLGPTGRIWPITACRRKAVSVAIGDVRRLNNGIDGGAVERQGPGTWVESYPL